MPISIVLQPSCVVILFNIPCSGNLNSSSLCDAGLNTTASYFFTEVMQPKRHAQK